MLIAQVAIAGIAVHLIQVPTFVETLGAVQVAQIIIFVKIESHE
jgi:hypothetical protein